MQTIGEDEKGGYADGHPQFGKIRVIDRNGEPWFVAADVCGALELRQVTNSLRKLDDDEKALISIKGISRGNDQTNIVNESGLYSLVLGSRKPEARAFKRWITHDVIPTIRKTGGYVADNAKNWGEHYTHPVYLIYPRTGKFNFIFFSPAAIPSQSFNKFRILLDGIYSLSG